jgi:CDP-glucose 4,6-dehydratase
MFNGIYKDKRVLVTGHTGFKGSWLVFWLQKLGAEVCGYSLPAPSNPSHWNLLKSDMRSEQADIRNAKKLAEVFASFKPEIVFHLAAQPLVRRSYGNPDETFETNVVGTVRVLDACRTSDSIRAIVNVTSDKCYENHEWVWGYRENDPMGGYDPYSASKGCAELVAGAYRRSYFNPDSYGTKHQILLASCRAGNVVGGGDWAEDRLIPDMMRAASRGETVTIRNPHATRPWQHVLEPLSGYLQIGQKLLEGQVDYSSPWNFGPEDEGSISVEKVARCIHEFWPKVDCQFGSEGGPHEAGLLKLDISKARQFLDWRPVWSSRDCFEHTTNWYRAFYEQAKVETEADLTRYILDATRKGIRWTE